MYCRNCGKEVNDEAFFCIHCGVKFEAVKKVGDKKIITKITKVKIKKNRNAVIAVVLAIISLIASLLPFSLGIGVLIAIYLAALFALFFRLKGKNEMYQLYEEQGKLIGKGYLQVSLVISIITLVCATISITNFL